MWFSWFIIRWRRLRIIRIGDTLSSGEWRMMRRGSFNWNSRPLTQPLGHGRTAVRPPNRKENHKIAKAACCEKKRGEGSSFFLPRSPLWRWRMRLYFMQSYAALFFRIVLHHNALLGSLRPILFHCRLAAFLDGETNVLFVKNKTFLEWKGPDKQIIECAITTLHSCVLFHYSLTLHRLKNGAK